MPLRCPHFSINVAAVPVAGYYQSLRLPIHHCALACEMIERLHTHPEGHAVATTLEARAEDGQLHPVSGPDIQAIHPTLCTADRHQTSCHPEFVNLLQRYGLDTSIRTEFASHQSRDLEM